MATGARRSDETRRTGASARTKLQSSNHEVPFKNVARIAAGRETNRSLVKQVHDALPVKATKPLAHQGDDTMHNVINVDTTVAPGAARVGTGGDGSIGDEPTSATSTAVGLPLALTGAVHAIVGRPSLVNTC